MSDRPTKGWMVRCKDHVGGAERIVRYDRGRLHKAKASRCPNCKLTRIVGKAKPAELVPIAGPGSPGAALTIQFQKTTRSDYPCGKIHYVPWRWVCGQKYGHGGMCVPAPGLVPR